MQLFLWFASELKFIILNSKLFFIVLDSSGKPGSAILKKQLKWLGSYDECVDTKGQYSLKNASSDGRTELTGKYCKVSLFLVSTNVEEPGIMTVCTCSYRIKAYCCACERVQFLFNREWYYFEVLHSKC